MLSASFELKKEDLLAFFLHHYAVSLRAKGERTVTRIVIPVTIFALAAYVFFEAPGGKPYSLIPVLVGILIAVFYPAGYETGLVMLAEKSLRKASYARFVESGQVTMSEEGIMTSSAGGAGNFLWAEVQGATLTPEYLFIVFGQAGGVVFPRREVAASVVEAMAAFVEEQLRKVDRRANELRQTTKTGDGTSHA